MTTPESSYLVVTRHQALVDYLVEQGAVAPGSRVVEHATEDDVRGQHVVGVLPIHLAALAASVTMVPMELRPEQRGRELTLEEVRAAAGRLTRYVVREVQAVIEGLKLNEVQQ